MESSLIFHYFFYLMIYLDWRLVLNPFYPVHFPFSIQILTLQQDLETWDIISFVKRNNLKFKISPSGVQTTYIRDQLLGIQLYIYGMLKFKGDMSISICYEKIEKKKVVSTPCAILFDWFQLEENSYNKCQDQESQRRWKNGRGKSTTDLRSYWVTAGWLSPSFSFNGIG